jgi:hypothetical protein
MSRNFEKDPTFLENPAHIACGGRSFLTLVLPIEKPKYNLLRGCLTNNWPPFTFHTLEPTPLSEIFFLRIQGYSWPCSKLRDICYSSSTPLCSAQLDARFLPVDYLAISHPKDWDSIFLRNVGKLLLSHTASHLRIFFMKQEVENSKGEENIK